MFGGNLAAVSERKARSNNSAKAKLNDPIGNENSDSTNGKNLSKTKLGDYFVSVLCTK